MSKRFDFVSLPNMYYLLDGITLHVPKVAEVLDAALAQLDKQTGIPCRVVQWNSLGANLRQPLLLPERGPIIVEVRRHLHREKGFIHVATVREQKNSECRAPAIFVKMRCSVLDIPMRVEVPLRALVKGDTLKTRKTERQTPRRGIREPTDTSGEFARPLLHRQRCSISVSS